MAARSTSGQPASTRERLDHYPASPELPNGKRGPAILPDDRRSALDRIPQATRRPGFIPDDPRT